MDNDDVIRRLQIAMHIAANGDTGEKSRARCHVRRYLEYLEEQVIALECEAMDEACKDIPF